MNWLNLWTKLFFHKLIPDIISSLRQAYNFVADPVIVSYFSPLLFYGKKMVKPARSFRWLGRPIVLKQSFCPTTCFGDKMHTKFLGKFVFAGKNVCCSKIGFPFLFGKSQHIMALCEIGFGGSKINKSQRGSVN